VGVPLRTKASASGDRFLAERRFFRLSIVYLFLLFVLLLVEATLGAVGLTPAGWPVLV